MTIILNEKYPSSWVTVKGKVLRELHLVIEVEITEPVTTGHLIIPKAIIAEKSFLMDQEQSLMIQRWFLLRNRIIPLDII